MKKNIIYALTLLFISCSHKQQVEPKSVVLTVLYDCTDIRKIQPNAEFILSLYGLDKAKETEAYFRVTTTTDMVLNPSREAYLPNSIATERANSNEDPYFREKNVLIFYSQVRQAIKENITSVEVKKNYNHSECFRTMCREITALQKKKCTKSILTVYSDLQENSDMATTYGQTKIDTARIKKTYIKSNLLPNNLTGLTIYFIFQPRDREEDKKFIMMYDLYQKLFEERGAKTVLQSDNNKTLNHD